MLRLHRDNAALYLTFLVMVVFVALRFFGGALFDNGWSFDHWRHLPGWYTALWLLLLAAAAALFATLAGKIGTFFSHRPRVIVGCGVLLGLLLLFQFDSFVYGGGNLRIAQVAQTDSVIYRWFEYGSVLTVSWLDAFFDLFDIHYNAAGVYAWKAFSFACTVVSLIGALKLARELTADAGRRLYLFLVLFLGPQTILHFAFVGVEPVVVAVSIWFALAALRLTARFTIKGLLAVWGLVLGGLFMHYTLIYLLPAAAYVTAHGRRGKGWRYAFALAAGLGTYVGLLGLTYWWAGQSLEFARSILFLAGKLPHSNYGIFSARHLGDLLQTLFLAFPQVAVAAYLLAARRRSSAGKASLALPLLMALGGMTVVLIVDPVNGIVVDYPRLTAYLFPLAFVLAALLVASANHQLTRLAGLLAAACLTLPLSSLPSYIRIARADPYVTDYLEKHDSYALSGCYAFRDAYFYRKDMDKANAWDRALPTKSPNYLNLEGAKSLAMQGQEAEALRTLYPVVAENPYWAEARAVLASIQMKLGRYRLAKPQIDTCLMLEPYRKEYLMNLYRYYRDVKSYPQALRAIQNMLDLFPSGNELKTDLMIIYYRSGALRAADSLAHALLAEDSTLPYPYLIKGFLAEIRGDTVSAIALLEKFIALAPNDPDTPAIMERLNELKWSIEEE